MSWDDIDVSRLARKFSYYDRRALGRTPLVAEIADKHEVNAVELRDAIWAEKQRLGID
jgi:hypothetical protein